jgi:hypothetical protein
MKAEDTESPDSLLKLAVHSSWTHQSAPDLRSTIDTCRFLLENAQLADIIKWMLDPGISIEDPRLAEWLLQTGTSYVYGQDAATLTEFCIRQLVLLLHCLCTRNDAIAILKRFLMSNSIQPAGSESMNWLFGMDWLGALFESLFQFEISVWFALGEPLSQFESFDVGKAFVDLLLDLDVNVKKFMVEQQKNYPKWEGISTYSGPRYHIIFDHVEGRGWVLGFEWSYDTQDPGFLVVSEYSIMATDAQDEDLDYWPYGATKWYRIHAAMRRFDRRMAAKAQKASKLSGQRLPPSRMPGSWIT